MSNSSSKFHQFLHPFLKFPFRYVQVDHFNPRASFSQVFPLSLECFFTSDGKQEGLPFNQIFDYTKATVELFDKVPKLSNDTFLEPSYDNETSLLVDLSNKVFVPLFGAIKFEKSHEEAMLGHDGIQPEHIGMGTSLTWHGSPDLRIESVCFLTCNAKSYPYYAFYDTPSTSYLTHSTHLQELRLPLNVLFCRRYHHLLPQLKASSKLMVSILINLLRQL